MNETTVRCHGCDGKGWIQVTDPPVYHYIDSGNRMPAPPIWTSVGTARVVICPVCGGAGGLIEGSVPPKPARWPTLSVT
jgi:hypothetical protein